MFLSEVHPQPWPRRFAPNAPTLAWLPTRAERGSTAATFCVPPPRPRAAGPPPQETQGDGPLVLNALLVAAERYSALKRARFGSETSAEALRGMRVLLCCLPEGAPSRSRSGGFREGVPTGGGECGVVWIGEEGSNLRGVNREWSGMYGKVFLCQEGEL